MGVNSLPKTVIRQRRGCDLNPGPSAPESSALTTRLPSHPLGRVVIVKTVNRGSAARPKRPKLETQKSLGGGAVSPLSSARRLSGAPEALTVARPGRYNDLRQCIPTLRFWGVNFPRRLCWVSFLMSLFLFSSPIFERPARCDDAALCEITSPLVNFFVRFLPRDAMHPRY